uniref:Uncharacterized protein n=1 Tax=Rhizophora mucronata TaxID=61149 RepID=A0A2P2P8G5_RHIMU
MTESLYACIRKRFKAVQAKTIQRTSL